MSWLRPDPILLVGMHRSGTTMLARMLDTLGVFVGARLEENHEAIAFLELNDSILARAHASWDRPMGILDLLEHEPACEAVAEVLSHEVESLGFRRSYLGTTGIARGLGVGPWGFKDPRSTLTWPLWLRLMPRARIVSVQRHGIDVAASLWRRAHQQLDQEPARYAGDPHLARFASVRCLDLDRAFELWDETCGGFDTLREQHPEAKILEIMFEDLLARPADVLGRVCEFLELGVDTEQITAVAGQADASRALAHRRDPELAPLVEQLADHPRLQRWNT